MKNTTLAVDDECYRIARIRAAELREPPYQRRCRQLREVFADFDAEETGLRMSENLARDALYVQATTPSRVTT